MHMAWFMFAVLRLLSAAGSTAIVFPARRTSLLQGGLHKVSALYCSIRHREVLLHYRFPTGEIKLLIVGVIGAVDRVIGSCIDLWTEDEEEENQINYFHLLSTRILILNGLQICQIRIYRRTNRTAQN